MEGNVQKRVKFAVTFRSGRGFDGFFRQKSDTEELADKAVISLVQRSHMPGMGLMVRALLTGKKGRIRNLMMMERQHQRHRQDNRQQQDCNDSANVLDSLHRVAKTVKHPGPWIREYRYPFITKQPGYSRRERSFSSMALSPLEAMISAAFSGLSVRKMRTPFPFKRKEYR